MPDSSLFFPPATESGFAAFLDRVADPRLRAVAEHWNQARGTRRMPGWKDIDPLAIAPHLSIMWSWRYDRASDSFTGRLAGTEIDLVFGKSLRGVPLREFFKGPEFDTIFARYKRVMTEPCLVRSKGHVFSHVARYGRGERIILPLAADGVHADGVLGATFYRVRREDEPALKDVPMAQEVEYFAL